MTVGDAAASLGISDKTLRRKLNQFKTKRLSNIPNSKIYLWVDDAIRESFSSNRANTEGLEDLLTGADHVTDADEVSELPSDVEEPVEESFENSAQAATGENPERSQTSASQTEQQKVFGQFLHEYMRPLIDKVEHQAKVISAKERIIEEQSKEIEDQSIQLRLLPDLQRKKLEEERIIREAEAKVAALNQQLEDEKAKQAIKDDEIENLTRRMADLEKAQMDLLAAKEAPAKSAWKRFFGL
jgi:myosin heavy subunit